MEREWNGRWRVNSRDDICAGPSHPTAAPIDPVEFSGHTPSVEAARQPSHWREWMRPPSSCTADGLRLRSSMSLKVSYVSSTVTFPAHSFCPLLSISVRGLCQAEIAYAASLCARHAAHCHTESPRVTYTASHATTQHGSSSHNSRAASTTDANVYHIDRNPPGRSELKRVLSLTIVSHLWQHARHQPAPSANTRDTYSVTVLGCSPLLRWQTAWKGHGRKSTRTRMKRTKTATRGRRRWRTWFCVVTGGGSGGR